MDITKDQYEEALSKMESLLKVVHNDTPVDDANSIELDAVSDMVERYEQAYYPVDKPTVGSVMREALFDLRNSIAFANSKA